MSSIVNHYEDPLVVENYQFRCPYSPYLFKSIASELGIDFSSQVIDLCCGGGEVTSHLANFTNQVWAVDRSELMLAKAPPRSNIKYLQGDVNDLFFLDKLPKNYFEFVFVGRGIHWVSPQSLSYITTECLISNGYLMTVQSGFRGSTDWLTAYYETLNELLSESVPGVDWVSRQKVLDAGYAYLKDFFLPFQIKVSLDFLLGQAMSYRVDRAQKIHENQANFFSKLKSTLEPFMVNGELLADVFSSASVYKKID